MKRGKITQPRSTISKLSDFKEMLVYKIFDHQKWNFLLPSFVGWFSFWWHHLFRSIVGAETALETVTQALGQLFLLVQRTREDEKWRPLHLHARHPLASTGDQSKTRNEIGPLKSATHSSQVRLLHNFCILFFQECDPLFYLGIFGKNEELSIIKCTEIFMWTCSEKTEVCFANFSFFYGLREIDKKIPSLPKLQAKKRV